MKTFINYGSVKYGSVGASCLQKRNYAITFDGLAPMEPDKLIENFLQTGCSSGAEKDFSSGLRMDFVANYSDNQLVRNRQSLA